MAEGIINSKESEMSILGTILYQPDTFPRIYGVLKPEDFYFPAHRYTYELMTNLHKFNLDINIKTVWNEMYKKGYTGLSESDLEDFLDYRVSLDVALSFASQVSEFSGYRILQSELDTLTPLVKSREKSLTEFVAEMSNIMRRVHSKGVNQTFKGGTALVDAYLEWLARPKNTNTLTGIPKIDKHIEDFDSKEITVIAARPGMGKALPLDAGVLTPSGWVKNRDVSVGSLVIGSDGMEYRVLGVYPQGRREMYSVEFSDGTSVVCDLEHLWETSTRSERRYGVPSVKTTGEIMSSIRINKDRRLNHSVKLVKPVRFPEKEVLVDPYLLGLYLGDGNYQQNVRVYSADSEIIEALEGSGYSGTVFEDRNLKGFRFSTEFSSKLDALGLTNLKSYEKFIPHEYLYNSIQVRESLLQGLLDTDGYVEKTTIEYSTTSERLALGVQELVRGLGGTATINSRMGYYTLGNEKRHTRINYRVTISFPDNGVTPFRLQRKLNKFSYVKRFSHKFIVNVVKLFDSTEMQCLAVSAPDNLFVTDGYTLTHNTAMMLQSARKNLEKGRSVGFLSMEMDASKLLNRLISSQVSLDSTILKDMTPEQIASDAKLVEALRFFSEVPMLIDDTGPFTSDTVPQKIRKMVYEHGCEIIYVDYIGLVQASPSLAKVNRQEQLTHISGNLKGLASELDIPIVVASQLNRESTKSITGRPTLAHLRDSGAIEQDASLVIFLYPDVEKMLMGGLSEGEVDEYMEGQDRVSVKFEVAKQRNGPIFVENLFFEKVYGQFLAPEELHRSY